MANTYNAELVCSVCCDAILQVLGKCIPTLDCFNRDCSLDILSPARPVSVPVHTVASVAQTNPTNWETGNNTLGAVLITPDQISQSFSVQNSDWQRGFRLQQLAEGNATVFAQTIIGKITAKLKWLAGPIPNPLVYPADGSGFLGYFKAWNGATFTAAALQPILGALPCCPRTCLWLGNKEYWSIAYNTAGNCCFVLTPAGGVGAYGFSSIQPNDVWTGADAALRGWAFCPQALILLSGLPAEMPCAGAFAASQTLVLPRIGLAVRVSTWCSVATRVAWVSYDIMFGCAVGDPTAAVLIEPGATPPTDGVVIS